MSPSAPEAPVVDMYIHVLLIMKHTCKTTLPSIVGSVGKNFALNQCVHDTAWQTLPLDNLLCFDKDFVDYNLTVKVKLKIVEM